MQGPLRDGLIQSLAPFPGPWLLALSGGLDSTVLLYAIRQLWPEESVHAVHINHGLQSLAKAFEDAARALCEPLGVVCHVRRLEKPEVFESGLEAWAREARYRAIESVAGELEIRTILLAHHADDQAETFLINLIRGTGIDGLRGMPVAARHHGLQWIRPLLKVTRSEILEQAKTWNLSWVEDPSNQDRSFLRNRIRHELVPLLETIRPGTSSRIVRLMQDLALEESQEATAIAELDLGILCSQTAEEKRLGLHNWAKKIAHRAPSRARLNALYELCFVSKSGRGHVKHGKFVFRRDGNRLKAEPSAE